MTIFLHRHIYHAELSVPKDVRHVIGRRRFRKTLNTSDIHEARRKEPIVVSAWKEQTKEQRLAKEKRDFVGNGKVIWTDGSITAVKKKEEQETESDDFDLF